MIELESVRERLANIQGLRETGADISSKEINWLCSQLEDFLNG